MSWLDPVKSAKEEHERERNQRNLELLRQLKEYCQKFTSLIEQRLYEAGEYYYRDELKSKSSIFSKAKVHLFRDEDLTYYTITWGSIPRSAGADQYDGRR